MESINNKFLVMGMRKSLFFICFLVCSVGVFGQENYYNVNPGNGYGLRFWNSDSYKIHMGDASEYKYGPVTSHSIKMNMNATPGRGWTWGISGVTPIAALSNAGDFQVAKSVRFAGGGGFYMQDNNWIRTYGDKNFYHNAGVMRTDGVLQVGPNGNRFKVDAAGNVGIGTIAPKSLLEINANTSGDAVLRIEADTNNSNESNNARIELYQDGSLHGAFMGFDNSWGGAAPDNIFRIVTRSGGVNDYSNFTINPSTSNVGIGTSSPDAKLAVNGDIHTKEVKVDLVGWADYVFEDTYNLPTLQQVENHISEKGHLINIPSAAEVAENGIQLGEMNAKLLEKIEELTLYTIAQEKKLERQESALKEQETINHQLKTNNQNLEARLAKIEVLFNKQ